MVSSKKKKILESGPAIFGAMGLYNSFGLLLGFLAAKVLKLPYEVQNQLRGMQNSGLGAALTTVHFSLLEAVMSAVFSMWHHVSGQKEQTKSKGIPWVVRNRLNQKKAERD
ncbi:hypothetical protein ACFQ9Y_09665 [Peribacillus simplex]|uniref:hypothetical protein n=1 Tax=Peribacillus simplex TaxID=1478 RepID=UPI00366C1EEF